MTVHLDTLAIAGKLKAAGFSGAQAEAVSFILRDAREAELLQLPTKSDLASEIRALEFRLEAKIEAGKAETIKRVLSAIGFQTLVMVAAIIALARSFQP
jgi:hypothetical protein